MLRCQLGSSIQRVLPAHCRPAFGLTSLVEERSGNKSQSPELGGPSTNGVSSLLSLCGCGHCWWLTQPQRLVHLAAYPQVMQQHGELPCHGHERPLLRVLAPTRG